MSDTEVPSGPLLGDAELITRSRAGDDDAFSELFSRHHEAARRLARQIANSSDADDLAAEAFTRVLSTLRGGGGPDVAFRAYLLTTVRRCAVDRARGSRRLELTDDLSAVDPGTPFVDTALETLERSLAARAFASLPERWQTVLWHTQVENEKPADVARLLGMTPNSVAALSYRAREGLRQAYLQMHLNDVAAEPCRWTCERLGAHVRGGLGARDEARLIGHLDGCDRCRATYLELASVNADLPGLLGPLVLGLAAGGYIASGLLAGAAAGGAAAGGAAAGSAAAGGAAAGGAATGGAAVGGAAAGGAAAGGAAAGGTAAGTAAASGVAGATGAAGAATAAGTAAVSGSAASGLVGAGALGAGSAAATASTGLAAGSVTGGLGILHVGEAVGWIANIGTWTVSGSPAAAMAAGVTAAVVASGAAITVTELDNNSGNTVVGGVAPGFDTGALGIGGSGNDSPVSGPAPTDMPVTGSEPLPTEPPADPPADNPPADIPTDPPTNPPTDPPTEQPTQQPTDPPTSPPTEPPTTPPTDPPTTPPSDESTDEPTGEPTDELTDVPTTTQPPTDPPVDPPPAPRADLTLDVSTYPDPLQVNGLGLLTATVHNGGDLRADGVRLIVHPAGNWNRTFADGAASTGWDCTGSTPTPPYPPLICTGPELGPKETSYLYVFSDLSSFDGELKDVLVEVYDSESELPDGTVSLHIDPPPPGRTGLPVLFAGVEPSTPQAQRHVRRRVRPLRRR